MSGFSGTDGGLCLCSAPGPGIRDGQNPYSSAGQDCRSPNSAIDLAYEGHYDGTHWEEGGKLSHILHFIQIFYPPQDEEN